MKKKSLYSIIIIIILTLLDQITKLLVVKFFDVDDYLIIIKDFLKFYYIKNIGASFGIFGGKTIMLILITFLVILYIIYEMKNNKNNKLSLFSCILILSGAFGNLIDRLFRGYVIDFISFTLLKKEMAIFNLADIYITFGVILYIYVILMEGNSYGNKSKRRR